MLNESSHQQSEISMRQRAHLASQPAVLQDAFAGFHVRWRIELLVMPNRILRASLRQSRRWNQCSFFDQVFFIRLLTLVDDYGRYEAHPQLLANECFPYGDEKGLPVTCQSIANSLTVICQADLAFVYNIEGNDFIQLNRWKERVRTKSKYPDPPRDGQMNVKCQSNDSQLTDKCSLPTPSPSPSPTSAYSEIPSRLEVLEEAKMRGVSENTANKFYDYHESNSVWLNRNGVLINWKYKLKCWSEEDKQKNKLPDQSTILPTRSIRDNRGGPL